MEDHKKTLKSFSPTEREIDQASIDKKIEQRRIAAKNKQNHPKLEIDISASVFNRCSNPRPSPPKIQVNNDNQRITPTL